MHKNNKSGMKDPAGEWLLSQRWMPGPEITEVLKKPDGDKVGQIENGKGRMNCNAR